MKYCDTCIRQKTKYCDRCLAAPLPNGSIGEPSNYMPEMETLEPINGKYEQIGKTIGQLVDEKNKAYGNSFNESSNFLKILYPDGIQVEQYTDMLGIIRVFDKLMRIANKKDAFGENPWNDIGGYAILKSDRDEPNQPSI